MQNCKNCGTQLRDGARFCPACGSPAEPPKQAAPNAGYGQPGQVPPNAVYGNPMPPKSNKKAFGIIAGIVGLIVVAAVLIVILLGRDQNPNKSYKTAAETWAKAYATRDFSLLLKAYPPDLREDVREELLWDFDDDEDEYWDEMYDKLEYYCGPHVKMSYKLGKAEQLDRDWEYYEWYFRSFYDYECDISAGYEVEVDATFRGADDTYEKTASLVVVQIEGKWYVLDFYP